MLGTPSTPPKLQRILHVDDDDDIRVIAHMALELDGTLKITQCSCGKDALCVIDEVNPDLILLDAMMPEMDGRETLLNIRKRPAFAKTPVVFMTARIEASAKQSMLDCGAVAVIVKPFDPMQLTNVLREIWQTLPGHHPKTA